MANSGHDEGQGHGHGHGAPLSNDLPPKPAPWRPQIKGWVNTHVADRTDYQPRHKPFSTAPVDPEVIRAAEVLAARLGAQRDM